MVEIEWEKGGKGEGGGGAEKRALLKILSPSAMCGNWLQLQIKIQKRKAKEACSPLGNLYLKIIMAVNNQISN